MDASRSLRVKRDVVVSNKNRLGLRRGRRGTSKRRE